MTPTPRSGKKVRVRGPLFGAAALAVLSDEDRANAARMLAAIGAPASRITAFRVAGRWEWDLVRDEEGDAG